MSIQTHAELVAELEGFLAALVEDVEDEATWRAVADWSQEHHGKALAHSHRNGLWQWGKCADDKEKVRKFTRAGALVDLFSLLAPTEQGRQRCLDVRLHDGWAESEPDISDYVAVGNWNAITLVDLFSDDQEETKDRSPEQLSEALERLGFDLEWSDQVSTCGQCNKLIRTEPDCWSWRPRFEIGDGEIVCHACSAPHEDEEPTEPEPDDYITDDYRNFYQNGRIVVRVGEDERWQDAVRAEMEGEQFWPSVWLAEERGGYTLLNLEDS